MSSKGYRGYIASRAIRGETTPQHVQNLVIRDYANRNDLFFKLSATEYAMEDCFMILEGVIEELETLDGIIVFSLFMLPKNKAKRRAIFSKLKAANCTFHAALENISAKTAEEFLKLDDFFLVDQFACENVEFLTRN